MDVGSKVTCFSFKMLVFEVTSSVKCFSARDVCPLGGVDLFRPPCHIIIYIVSSVKSASSMAVT